MKTVMDLLSHEDCEEPQMAQQARASHHEVTGITILFLSEYNININIYTYMYNIYMYNICIYIKLYTCYISLDIHTFHQSTCVLSLAQMDFIDNYRDFNNKKEICISSSGRLNNKPIPNWPYKIEYIPLELSCHRTVD